MQRWNDLGLLAARVLIAALFVAGTVQKLVDPSAAQALLTGKGLPQMLIVPALAFNALAAVYLLAGIKTRPMAVALAAYCIVTSWFHLVPDDGWQMSIFIKNWAIAGGCLALAVAGSGRIAVRPDRPYGV